MGYPEDATPALGLHLTNTSCPGEASGGFINPTGTDNGCRSFRSQLPLHVSYPGTQLDYALSYLRSHRGTKLVSLTLGANDLFVCQQHTTDGCAAPAELAATLSTYQQNLTTILSRIRAVYHGQLVAVTYYSTNYADPRITVPIAALNAVTTSVTTRFGGQIADGFTAFAHAAASTGGNSCTAGLLLKNPADSTGQTCDIHPSTTGAQLLATTLTAAGQRAA